MWWSFTAIKLKPILLILFGFVSIAAVQANPGHQDDAEESGSVVLSVAWSPNGDRIAVGKGQATCGTDFGDPRFAIDVLDGLTFNPVLLLNKPRCTAKALAWSPDGNTLISSSDDGAIWFWDPITGELLHAETIAFQGPSVLLWTPNGEKVIGVVEGSIFVFDSETTNTFSDFEDYKTKIITSIALSPDGSEIVSGDTEGEIRILDTSTRQVLFSFPTQVSIPTAFAWSPDGDTIASGHDDGKIRIWNAASGVPILVLDAHMGVINKVVWNSDGTQLVSGGDDNAVRIWDASGGGLLEAFQYPGRVLALDWSPDDTQVAYGGVRSDFQDTTIQIVDAPSIVSCDLTIPASDTAALISAITSANGAGTPQTLCLTSSTYTLDTAPAITGDITLLGHGATLVLESSSGFDVTEGGRLSLEGVTVIGGDEP